MIINDGKAPSGCIVTSSIGNFVLFRPFTDFRDTTITRTKETFENALKHAVLCYLTPKRFEWDADKIKEDVRNMDYIEPLLEIASVTLEM